MQPFGSGTLGYRQVTSLEPGRQIHLVVWCRWSRCDVLMNVAKDGCLRCSQHTCHSLQPNVALTNSTNAYFICFQHLLGRFPLLTALLSMNVWPPTLQYTAKMWDATRSIKEPILDFELSVHNFKGMTSSILSISRRYECVCSSARSRVCVHAAYGLLAGGSHICTCSARACRAPLVWIVVIPARGNTGNWSILCVIRPVSNET